MDYYAITHGVILPVRDAAGPWIVVPIRIRESGFMSRRRALIFVVDARAALAVIVRNAVVALPWHLLAGAIDDIRRVGVAWYFQVQDASGPVLI
jgi:hypothetical protein